MKKKFCLVILVLSFFVNLPACITSATPQHTDTEAHIWRHLYSNPQAAHILNSNSDLLKGTKRIVKERVHGRYLDNQQELDLSSKLEHVILSYPALKHKFSVKCFFCCSLCGGEGQGELGPCYHNCDVTEGCSCP